LNLPCKAFGGSLSYNLDKTDSRRLFDMFTLLRLTEAGSVWVAWELLMVGGEGLHISRTI